MMIQNPFVSPRTASKQPYNYETNLLCNFRVGEMLAVIERACETCPRCQLRKKNHYCIEPRCCHKQLICVECDTNSIAERHYMHDHTYILPLLSRDIAANFYKLKRRITNYHKDINEEIAKMEEYLADLRKVEVIARGRMLQLEEEELTGRIGDYTQKMEEFLHKRREGDRMASVLQDVHFTSAQECMQKEEEIRSEIIGHLNSLKWPKDPQKVLKEKLLKSSLDEEKREIFISCRRAVEVSEIDAHFRTSQQFYTQNLQNHPVDIKIEQDYLAKPRFYESFIHHFRNCTHLTIQNGTLAHLRTPIAFRKLRELDFAFTCDMETQGTRVEQVGGQLTAVTLRRLREEDVRVLKAISGCSSQLSKLHLDFANKSDLFAHKELIEFLETLTGNNLVNFTLRLRTENQVKRLYGYLSKFYRDYAGEGASNLADSLLSVLETNSLLSKVVVEGIKPLSMPAVLARLKALPFLMDYKIYYENLDLMTEVDDRQAKQLQAICYKRKRIFYALAKAAKEKRYPRTVINRVAQEMLI